MRIRSVKILERLFITTVISFIGCTLGLAQQLCTDGEKQLYFRRQGDKIGFVDRSGEFVVAPKFDDALMWFTNNETAAQIDGRWGIINERGSWTVSPQFPRITSFSKNLIVTTENRKYSLIDRRTKSVLGVFDEVGGMRGDLVAFKLRQKWGFFDHEGKIVIQPKYDDASSFSEGLALVEIAGRFFYIDKSEQKILKLPANISGGNFSEGLAIFTDKTGRKGFIDKTGKIVIKPIYKNVGSEFDEGYVEFNELDLHGFLNRQGRVTVPAIYDFVSRFSEGLAWVQLNGKQGFIDQKGRVAIPIKYDSAGWFVCGIAVVEIDGKWGFINKTGQFISEPKSIK